MSSESVNNSPNFTSARTLVFPDGTLTPEAKKALERKPDDTEKLLAEQNRRIRELLTQVKKLEDENKQSKEIVRRLPF